MSFCSATNETERNSAFLPCALWGETPRAEVLFEDRMPSVLKWTLPSHCDQDLACPELVDVVRDQTDEDSGNMR